ncbi:hypothetical protein [Streptacidiphilus sp. PAMC 29251]
MREPNRPCSAVDWSITELSVASAWQAMCAAFAAEESGRLPNHVKLAVEGEFVTEPQRWPHRVRRIEEGPAPWLAALEPLLGGNQFFLWARGVQQHRRGLFEALVEALTPHLAQRGVPSGPVEAEVFFGNYGRTPGGIHRESCTNIHLVLQGCKQMHFWLDPAWPPDGTPMRTDSAPDAGTREEYLPDLDPVGPLAADETITAEEGSGFCWAAGTWHLGGTLGAAMALNIAAYQQDLDSASSGLPLWDKQFRGEVPHAWLAAYRDHTGARRSAAGMLADLSGLGMRPAPAERRLAANGTMTCVTSAPLLWQTRRGKGRLLVAALGAVTEVPDRAVVRDWLTDAVHPDSGPFPVPPPCRGIANWLYGQGILDIPEDL